MTPLDYLAGSPVGDRMANAAPRRRRPWLKILIPVALIAVLLLAGGTYTAIEPPAAMRPLRRGPPRARLRGAAPCGGRLPKRRQQGWRPRLELHRLGDIVREPPRVLRAATAQQRLALPIGQFKPVSAPGARRPARGRDRRVRRDPVGPGAVGQLRLRHAHRRVAPHQRGRGGIDADSLRPQPRPERPERLVRQVTGMARGRLRGVLMTRIRRAPGAMPQHSG